MARKHQIGRKMGRTIIFSLDDCQKLYEVLPCPSGSFAAPNRPIGSSAALSAKSALKKALARVISGSPKKSGQSARHKSLPSQSTVVAPPIDRMYLNAAYGSIVQLGSGLFFGKAMSVLTRTRAIEDAITQQGLG